jgi:hypothetical protein
MMIIIFPAIQLITRISAQVLYIQKSSYVTLMQCANLCSWAGCSPIMPLSLIWRKIFGIRLCTFKSYKMEMWKISARQTDVAMASTPQQEN